MGLAPCRCCPGYLEDQTTNYRKSTIYPTSHQSSDLTLRLHCLQAAHFTEEGVKRSLRPATAFMLASHFHLAAPPDIYVHKAGLSLLSDMYVLVLPLFRKGSYEYGDFLQHHTRSVYFPSAGLGDVTGSLWFYFHVFDERNLALDVCSRHPAVLRAHGSLFLRLGDADSDLGRAPVRFMCTDATRKRFSQGRTFSSF